MLIWLVEMLEVVFDIGFKIPRQTGAIFFGILEHALFAWMELLIEGKEGIKVRGEKLAATVIDTEQVLALEGLFDLS